MPDCDWFRDTDPRALKVFIDLQRKMSADQKIRTVFESTEMAIRLSEADVRARYPQADDREVFLRAASRRLDRDTMIQVYGWDPNEHK